MGVYSNTNEFINKAHKIHGELFDYSEVVYVNAITNIKIICKEHGVFMQTPNSHLCGSGCTKCKNQKANERIRLLCKDNFVSKAVAVHGNVYDYSLVNYITATKKVKIICSIHGVFEQIPNSHLRGSGCGYCKGRFIHEAKKHTPEIFINKAILIHGDKYDYSLVCYYNARQKVDIICPKHGVFHQAPHLHLRGEGCPSCRESGGERAIALFLDKIEASFERQKMFDDCRNKNPLKFDFFIPDKNIIIEYHGQQHFIVIEAWGGFIKLMNIRKVDEYKKRWAIENGYKFIEYTYKDKWEFIEKNLTKIILNNK